MQENENRIEQLKIEIKYRDEQLEEARKALHGTVETYGSLERVLGTDGIMYKWNINVSSILTTLIKEVGRLCDSYASDLFVSWGEIQKQLDNGSIHGSERYIFAIRDSGVDHAAWYENHKDEHNYYRAVWFLDVEATDGKIKMTLHK